MRWLFLLLIFISAPIITLGQRLPRNLGESVGEEVKAPVEDYRRVLEVDEEELFCMTLALYKESRGESERGSILVAQVIMNRTKTKGFKNTVCGVVKRKLNGNCMFSFWCTPNREKINDIEQFKRLTGIAYKAILGEYEDYTESKYFKRCDIKSRFFNKLTYLGKEGNHCFFK